MGVYHFYGEGWLEEGQKPKKYVHLAIPTAS